jgi:hypothetical protein
MPVQKEQFGPSPAGSAEGLAVELADLAREVLEHAPAEGGYLLEHGEELPLWDDEQLAVGVAGDGGRPGAVVEQGQLADDGARPEEATFLPFRLTVAAPLRMTNASLPVWPWSMMT